MTYGEKKRINSVLRVGIMAVHAGTPRTEEPSTTIPWQGSKAASLWRKKNVAPIRNNLIKRGGI